MYIYHVLIPDEWSYWKERSFYDPPKLASEGFIHCSFEDQLSGVIERYYRDVPRLAILKIDTAKLVSKLVAEASTNDEQYPHVYGPINTDAVVDIEFRENIDADAATQQ